MTSLLSDRLNAARQRWFVGRDAERALFHSALTAPEPPFQLLYVFGPGGVGKTTLLDEFASLCSQAQATAIHLDARNVEPSPDSFLSTLRLALDLDPQESPLHALSESSRRHVLLIDTYETLVPLDGWLRDVFLPRLPENTLIVLAGRQPPAPGWLADPGWHELLHVLPLRNLGRRESGLYLARRGVPEDQHETVLDFTHGHPLALSLVADVYAQRGDVRFHPESAPDVVRMLLERLVQKVPGPAHRVALEASSLVHFMTEPLLAAMLTLSDAHELFEWLRTLSFVESGPFGLFPHDLTREALMADLRWRNPEWFKELHRRARTYYTEYLRRARDQEQQRVLFDYVFLHRDNQVVRPFFEWQSSGVALTEAPRETDKDALVSMVIQQEGEESAELLSYWMARQPQGGLVFRGGEVGDGVDSLPAGFMHMVALEQVRAEDREMDPAVRAAWLYLHEHSPLRTGESATLFRFWMARDTYQAVSPIQSLVFITAVRHYLTRTGPSFTFFPCADPEFWAPVFAYADLTRIPEADFEVGGRRYGMYGHDWRSTPPLAWLEMLAEREVGDSTGALSRPVSEPILVLSESTFASAVHAALRDFTRADVLGSNPLLRSRVVIERAGVNSCLAERISTLQSLIREAAASLQESPRQAGLYQALQHTYLQPAATQERAAELLGLPFSTYRRHLKSGIAQVVSQLWQQELRLPAGAIGPGDSTS